MLSELWHSSWSRALYSWHSVLLFVRSSKTWETGPSDRKSGNSLMDADRIAAHDIGNMSVRQEIWQFTDGRCRKRSLRVAFIQDFSSEFAVISTSSFETLPNWAMTWRMLLYRHSTRKTLSANNLAWITCVNCRRRFKQLFCISTNYKTGLSMIRHILSRLKILLCVLRKYYPIHFSLH